MSEHAIALDRASKRFGRTIALDRVSFAVAPGEVLGFVGRNGAGKTTALRVLSGFIDLDSGRARVLGTDVASQRTAVAAIGYLPESVPLYRDMRISEYLRFRARLKGIGRAQRAERIADACQRCGLSGAERRIIGHLSKGWRQRVGLADTLLARPPVLLLDEPT
ncbi:MAG: ABC transporter ATP-binding protein, partial [Myxococcota bacterium]